MATVDPEKKLQSRVLHWLKDDLGYTYIGDLRDIDNTPIKEDLLSANLKKRGYTDDQIKTAIGELVNKAGNQVDSLYQINRSVYSLLRYGRQGTKDAHGHRPTVHYIDWFICAGSSINLTFTSSSNSDSFLPLSIRSYIFFLYSSSLSCIGS